MGHRWWAVGRVYRDWAIVELAENGSQRIFVVALMQEISSSPGVEPEAT